MHFTLRNDLLPLLRQTWQEFQEDDAGELGAALSYYAMFSLAPLLLLLLAGLGWFLGSQTNVQQQILTVIEQQFSPQLSATLRQVLEGITSNAGAATGVGVVLLLLGASGVFQQLDRSFNRIWNVPKPESPTGWVHIVINTLREKVFSFGMVLAVGFLLLISLALTGVTTALLSPLADVPLLGRVTGVAGGLVVTLLLDVLIFALLFKYLPDTEVAWRDVWLGAILTAIIWEIGKRLLAIYVERSSFASGYGAVGTTLVLMIWVYFSSQILFLGAEFTQVFACTYGSHCENVSGATTTMGDQETRRPGDMVAR